MRTRAALAGLALLGLLGMLGCSAQEPAGSAQDLLVVVSAPLSTQPWVGEFTRRGAELAAADLRDPSVRVEVLDHGGSPQRAAANAREAVRRGADVLVTDGVGTLAVAEVSEPARLPVFVVFEGGASLVDPAERPTVFRLAPANRHLTTRLGDYLSERAQRVALLADDTSFGREGAVSTRAGLARNEVALVSDAVLPAGDVGPQVLAARRAGAQALVVWSDATRLAAVVRAARGSGWDVPVYAGPTAADPLVRQRLADRPEWLDGLTFVSFRITSEVGPEPFAAYRAAYEKRFGIDEVGVSAGGRPVVAPPDWSTYSYDAVRLVHAATQAGGPLLDALQTTVITGANGDERGYGPTDREGVSPDDVYFARFQDLRFVPVSDDILSTGLPTVPQ